MPLWYQTTVMPLPVLLEIPGFTLAVVKDIVALVSFRSVTLLVPSRTPA